MEKYFLNSYRAEIFLSVHIPKTAGSLLAHIYKKSNIDILFRSGKEKRISGFFPTKILYSELFFSNKYWPDIKLNDLNETIKKFYKRNRRYGK